MSFAFAFFAFGEEARMIRDMAISTITVGGLLTGCLASSILVAGEFEKQTVLAVLCKPVSRGYFILGKYLGILSATCLLVLSQGFVLEVALIIRNYSTVHSDVTSFLGMIDYLCILGICFSLLQILILTAISLALSLYLNTIANLTLCLVFFIFCNTFSYILPIYCHGSKVLNTATAVCYAIFPNIQILNIEVINEVVTSSSLLWQKNNIIQYIVYVFAHSAIYCAGVVWLVIFLFKKKELA